MDSISTARDFFINQQGLSPDQADMIVSKGMEAYNQQSWHLVDHTCFKT
jgi:hypothetical protein